MIWLKLVGTLSKLHVLFILKPCLLPAYQTVSLFEWLSEDYVSSNKNLHCIFNFFFQQLLNIEVLHLPVWWDSRRMPLNSLTTFLIHSVVLTVTVYCVQGLFGIIKKCSLKFSRDVSYKLFILVVSVFIMFHDLTQNFYRNCTRMSSVMHYSYFKRILQYQYVPYCIIIWGLL